MESRAVSINDKLKDQLPTGFYEIACRWMYDLNFELKITRPRKTKLGDFRYDRKTGSHIVTVNSSENTWSFLITFAHEAAHSAVYRKYGSGRPHHGKEWKALFRAYLLEILASGLVPDNLARAIARYAKNPRASTGSFSPLLLALKELDPGPTALLLKDIDPGSNFEFRGKTYLYISRKRTRALCELHPSGRRYLIPLVAEIKAA